MARRRPRPTIREENERALLEAAEWIFAEQGFAGATTAAIARRAGVPKANLHYYFPTKEGLYRSVIERVLTAWLAAASSFATSDAPRVALSAYIGAKRDLAREMPLATRIWSAEIMRGAPMIQDFLDTTLTEWVVSRERAVKRWIVSGMRIPLLSAGLREAMCPGRTGSASRTGAWLQRRSGCRATRLGRRTACLDRAIVGPERGDRRGPRSGTRSAAAVRVRWRSGSAIGTTRTAAVS